MRRLLAAILPPVAILLLALQSAPAAPPCQPAQECQHLPLVVNPVLPTNTPLPTHTPTATIGPTNTPQLPPPTFNNCQADPNPSAAPNYPIVIININKVAETVTLQNIGSAAIDLTGWKMCSITGNQMHPIGGTLQVGQVQTFPNTGGPIWNNIEPDPGALYTPDGRLVSYYSS